MAITPLPSTQPSVPWQAPWYRPPTPMQVGSGRTNSMLPPVGKPDLPAAFRENSFQQSGMPPRGPQPDYNMQWPSGMRPAAAPWYGQPLLPHQVNSPWATPNPWMPQTNLHGGWETYQQPQLPMPWFMPEQQPPTPMGPGGWHGAEVGGQVMQRGFPLGSIAGNGAGGNPPFASAPPPPPAQPPQPRNQISPPPYDPWAGLPPGSQWQFPFGQGTTEGMPNWPPPPAPGEATGGQVGQQFGYPPASMPPPPPPTSPWLAPWYGQGLY